MSKQIKSQRIRTSNSRPFSANLPRSRPSSGHLAQSYHRKEMIQNTYSPASHCHHPSTPKGHLIRQLSVYSNGQKLKRRESRHYKPKEVMAEQIVSLKLKINDLVTELGHQRGKNEELRKKNHKFSRVLNVQFQNERVWNAGIINTHKVEGIRSMYDRLKQDHEKLKKDYEELLMNVNVTKELEYIKYIEILETELRELRTRYDRIAQNSLQLLAHENDYQNQARLHLAGETEHQYDQLNERYVKLKAKFQMTVENLKDRNQKVEFLDRYCKELENRIQQVQRKGSSRQKEHRKTNEELVQTIRECESVIEALQLENAELKANAIEMLPNGQRLSHQTK